MIFLPTCKIITKPYLVCKLESRARESLHRLISGSSNKSSKQRRLIVIESLERSERNFLSRTIVTLTPVFWVVFTSLGINAAEEFVDLPRDLEVELALSALPEDLREGASIYIRDSRKGFVLHREGTNDWMTFVARTSVRFCDADWEYQYPSDQLIPMAYDKVGIS